MAARVRWWRRLRRALLLAPAVALLLQSPTGFLHYLRDPDPGFQCKNLEIVSILPGSPAEEAGLRPGDRLLAIDGVRLHFQSELRGTLHALRTQPGYSLVFHRDGSEQVARLRTAVPPAGRVRARLVNLLVGLIFLTVGAVVVLRRDDAVGVLFQINASLLAAVLLEHPVALQPVLRFLGDLLWDFAQLLLPATLLHFFLLFPAPEARPGRDRLRRWLYLPPAVLAAATLVAQIAIHAGSRPSPGALQALQIASGVYFALYLLGGIARFTRAVRRARDPGERERLAIVLWGVLLGFLPLTLVVLAKQLRPGQDLPGLEYISLSLALVPLGFGYAIAKHGALEIRAVLRGGLLYLLLTLVLVLFYFTVVDGLAAALARRQALPELLVSLGSISLVAFTFAPLRAGLERLLDSALYPEQKRIQAVLQVFAREVAAELRTEDIVACLRRRVKQLFGVPGLWLYVLDPKGGASGYGLREVSGSSTFPLHSTVGRYVVRHGRTLMAEYLRGSSLERHLDDESRAFLAQRGVAVALPVPLGGSVRAVLCVPRKPHGALFTTSEAGVLRDMAQQAALALENVALHGERFEKLRLREELQVAHRVQAGLIPVRPPAVEGLDVAGQVLASEEVSGDYYDFMRLDAGRLGVAVGDVAGHGVPAAILMACMQMSLRGEARPERSPAEVMRRLNEQVSGWLAEGRFVSLFYGVYQPDQELLTYCNAGLDPPLLFRRAGYVDRLQCGGTVLGVGRQQDYRDGVLKLFPDELVLIHTDGIVEQADARGEPFGQERLVRLVQEHVSEPLDRLRERIFDAVLQFGAACSRDDMTVVLLRLARGAGGRALEVSGPTHA